MNLRITTDMVKALRDETGAGIMDCKTALEAAGGNIDKAKEIIAERGIALAAKRANRVASQGLIDVYVHAGGRIGAMVEVNCETDFVARTNEFRQLAHDIAMQIAAMGPKYIDLDEWPQGEDGLKEEDCLLYQPFIKDPNRTIGDLIRENIGKTGENIRVRRFARFELGN